jgi:hypothetical protein
VTNGTYDPVLGTATGGTSADAPCHGIFKQITDEYAKAFAVEANDQLAVIDGSVEPLMTDLLVVGASALAIVKIIAVNPAGTPLAYTLQVRGAIDTSANGGAFDSTQATRTIRGGDFDNPSTGPDPVFASGGTF